MKYIGIDYGDARVGVASTDLGGTIASAVCIIKVKGIEDAVEKVSEKYKELGGEALVIGLPRTTNGKNEYRVERTKRFAQMISERLSVEPRFFDERFTSLEADRYLSEGGVHGKKRKQVLDALAAQIILQDYVDSQKA